MATAFSETGGGDAVEGEVFHLSRRRIRSWTDRNARAPNSLPRARLGSRHLARAGGHEHHTRERRHHETRDVRVCQVERLGMDAARSSPEPSTPGPVHVVEILDHPGLLRRVPTQPLLRQRARRWHVQPGEERHPAEMAGGFCGGQETPSRPRPMASAIALPVTPSSSTA